MLGGAGADAGAALAIVILQPLALAEGVEDEDHVAIAGQSLREGLICVGGLPLDGVPADTKHCRDGAVEIIRHVEIACHRQVRPGLEDDFLDGVRIALDRPDRAGVERRLRGLASECLPEPFADVLLVLESGLLRAQAEDGLAVAVADGAHPAHHVLLHHPTEAVKPLHDQRPPDAGSQ